MTLRIMTQAQYQALQGQNRNRYIAWGIGVVFGLTSCLISSTGSYFYGKSVGSEPVPTEREAESISIKLIEPKGLGKRIGAKVNYGRGSTQVLVSGQYNPTDTSAHLRPAENILSSSELEELITR